MPRLPTTDDFHSPVHDTRVVARLGLWLGIAFGICFLTGLVSHVQQHPLGGLAVPPVPAWGYRVTQGVHVFTGVFNGAQWYVFGFGFTAVHWALGWVAVGALLVHVAVKLPVIRDALTRPIVAGPGPERDRRWFLRGALGVAAGAVALTVGQAIPALEPLVVLGKRHPRHSPLGVPVNRTAVAAGVGEGVDEATWQIRLVGPGGSWALGWDELTAMPQT